MIFIYKLATILFYPFVPIYLRVRILNNKEDKKRINERYGIASSKKKSNKLIWLHAASIGESLSIISLVKEIQNKNNSQILVTTGTKSSAQLITKKLTLGRLESSQEFKAKSPKIKKTKEVEIENLKITVRDLNEEDISSRKLNKNTKGVVIMEISNISPLKGLLNVNDIIIEVQKTKITKSSDLNNVVNQVKKRGDKNLLLSVIDKNNQSRYLGVKLK